MLEWLTGQMFMQGWEKFDTANIVMNEAFFQDTNRVMQDSLKNLPNLLEGIDSVMFGGTDSGLNEVGPMSTAVVMRSIVADCLSESASCRPLPKMILTQMSPFATAVQDSQTPKKRRVWSEPEPQSGRKAPKKKAKKSEGCSKFWHIVCAWDHVRMLLASGDCAAPCFAQCAGSRGSQDMYCLEWAQPVGKLEAQTAAKQRLSVCHCSHVNS